MIVSRRQTKKSFFLKWLNQFSTPNNHWPTNSCPKNGSTFVNADSGAGAIRPIDKKPRTKKQNVFFLNTARETNVVIARNSLRFRPVYWRCRARPDHRVYQDSVCVINQNTSVSTCFLSFCTWISLKTKTQNVAVVSQVGSNVSCFARLCYFQSSHLRKPDCLFIGKPICCCSKKERGVCVRHVYRKVFVCSRVKLQDRSVDAVVWLFYSTPSSAGFRPKKENKNDQVLSKNSLWSRKASSCCCTL